MKRIKILSMMLLAVVALCSCNNWEDPEFQVPVYDGPAANHTIADIKAKYVTDAQMPICGDNETFIVKAVVVSSDQGGNCYKYMTVQDETGGIEIALDRTGLYNDFPVGQTVYIDCRGLVVGAYHNKHQIGWKYNGSVGRINPQAISKCIHKDGLPNPNHPFLSNPIDVQGLNELTADNVNCFVRINGCTFDAKHNGKPLSTNDVTTDRDAYINGQAFTVRTSNYANFRSIVIDSKKKYCLYGILTVYNKEYQLTLRTKEDIQDANVVERSLFKELTFNENSLTSGGWTMSPNNEAWKYQTFSGNKFVYHNSTNDNCDDWLISPSITVDELTGKILCLEHQNNVAGSPADYYQVYYSTTYNGKDFKESDWVAFNPNLTNFPNSFSASNDLDLSVIPGKTFYIALRYHKNAKAAGTRWEVKSLQFYKYE